jgi:hypothetical protein
MRGGNGDCAHIFIREAAIGIIKEKHKNRVHGTYPRMPVNYYYIVNKILTNTNNFYRVRNTCCSKYQDNFCYFLSFFLSFFFFFF